MSELKPCPFCGGKASLQVAHKMARIDCPTCERHHWEADVPCRYQGADGLIEWWNTRAERTCHIVIEDECPVCSECGEDIDPSFAACPYCGARVVVE